MQEANFVADSLLEGDGFEPSVPPRARARRRLEDIDQRRLARLRINGDHIGRPSCVRIRYDIFGCELLTGL